MIQKKYLYGLLMSVACLSACTNEVETDDNVDGNIHFSFGVGGIEETLQTRGSVTTGTQGTGNTGQGSVGTYYFQKSLKVYAVQDEGGTPSSYANVTNVYAKETGTAYGYYNTKVKWPANIPLTFYAFAPATALNADYPKITANDTDLHKTANTYNAGVHTVLSPYAAQEDLLFGKSTVNRTGADGDVPMELNHILSRITFEVRIPDKDTNEAGHFLTETIKLKSVSLKSVYSKATGTFGNGVSGVGFSWATYNTPANFTMGFGTDGKTVTSSAFGTSYLQTDAASGNSMFMLPQTNTHFSTNSSKLEIVYKISSETTDRTVTFDLKDQKDANGSTAHYWKIGRWTNYQITIKANYIVLSPITVAGWDGPNNIDIEVTE